MRPVDVLQGGVPLVRSVVSWAIAWGVALSPVVAAQAAPCYTPSETAAVEVRMLQSELMVAALACRDSNPELGMIDEYNAFARLHSARLVKESKILQAHFRRVYGAAGIDRFAAFETALANEASKRSMTSAGYCQEAAAVFRQVSTLQRSDLEQFAEARAMELGLPVKACTATATAEAR